VNDQVMLVPGLWMPAAAMTLLAARLPPRIRCARFSLQRAQAETVVEGMTVHALVPLGHSVLIASGRVARMVERFISGGRFE
jgi:hypothetical protein